MALFSQEKRHIKLSTPLGNDVVFVESMQGREGISRLFSLELSLLSENQSIPFEEIIGSPVTISIELSSGSFRFLNGIVSRFGQGSGSGTTTGDTRISRYRATVVPRLWLLSRSSDSKIYQHMSAPEIVEKVLKDHGLSDFKINLQREYRRRDYCVQYRETHLNFVCRLLEDEGIRFFFEHGDGKHTLIISDSGDASPCPGQSRASYGVHSASHDDIITSLEKFQEIRSGNYTVNDYNFEFPHTALKVEMPSKYRFGPGNREIYDYPAEYGRKEDGETVARVRIEEEEAQITTVHGTSNCRAFASGYSFRLENFYRTDMNGRDFLLTAIEHHVAQEVQSGGHFEYSNVFTCIPAEIPFRPVRDTPRPYLTGSQTATVVGPAGEEVYTDEYGRVKVQFHWDREGSGDEKSSCWIRVSQLFTGTNWGAIFIPRIGQEVILDFLEGDPDRPIITGRVYNGINKPPYDLPAKKSCSTLKSDSSPGGGGFNEIRFEDKKGGEQIFVHAEGRQDVRVKQDSLEWVGNERHLVVVKDRLEKVGGDQHLEIIGDCNERIGGTLSLRVADDLQQKAGARHALAAGQEIHLKAGMKVVLEAGVQISLKVGGSFIDIGPAGVSIDGPAVNIKSGGAPGSGAGSHPDAPKAAKEAGDAAPGKNAKASPAPKVKSRGPQAAAFQEAAANGAPFCDK